MFTFFFSVFCFLFASKAACSRDFRAQIRLVCSSDLALPATRRDRVEFMPSMASRYSQRPSGPDDDKRRSFKDGWGQAPGGGGASSSAPPIMEKRKREQPEDDSASKKLDPFFPPYLVYYYFIFPHCSLFLLVSLLTPMWNPFRFFSFFFFSGGRSCGLLVCVPCLQCVTKIWQKASTSGAETQPSNCFRY